MAEKGKTETPSNDGALWKQLRETQKELKKETELRINAERDLKWAQQLTGDGDDKSQEVKKGIFDSNIELSKRETDLGGRESTVATKLRDLSILSLVAEMQQKGVTIDPSSLIGMETDEEIKAAATRLYVEALEEKQKSGNNGTQQKPAGDGSENVEMGIQTGGKKAVKDMTDAEFTEHKKGLQAEATAKGL